MRLAPPAYEPPPFAKAFVLELARHYPTQRTDTPPTDFAFLLLGLYATAAPIAERRAVAMARNFIPRIQEIGARLGVEPNRLEWRWDDAQGLTVYVFEK